VWPAWLWLLWLAALGAITAFVAKYRIAVKENNKKSLLGRFDDNQKYTQDKHDYAYSAEESAESAYSSCSSEIEHYCSDNYED